MKKNKVPAPAPPPTVKKEARRATRKERIPKAPVPDRGVAPGITG